MIPDLPSPSEYRLPVDELIRQPYRPPDWWDAEVKWTSPKKSKTTGRGKAGAATVKTKIVAALQKKPWQTVAELIVIVGAARRTVNEILCTGYHDGKFSRRTRIRREFEFANLRG